MMSKMSKHTLISWSAATGQYFLLISRMERFLVLKLLYRHAVQKCTNKMLQRFREVRRKIMTLVNRMKAIG